MTNEYGPSGWVAVFEAQFDGDQETRRPVEAWHPQSGDAMVVDWIRGRLVAAVDEPGFLKLARGADGDHA
ncbi:hypothetical protein [Streptomyces sp. NBC_00158]|uniref:hypothetical protein n=1 Tax=Streptomyces sp. NBC_00158 TaxID=2903627 RepID=UPI002F9183BF